MVIDCETLLEYCIEEGKQNVRLISVNQKYEVEYLNLTREFIGKFLVLSVGYNFNTNFNNIQ